MSVREFGKRLDLPAECEAAPFGIAMFVTLAVFAAGGAWHNHKSAPPAPPVTILRVVPVKPIQDRIPTAELRFKQWHEREYRLPKWWW